MRYRAGVSENLSSQPDFGYPSDQFADPRGGQLPWQHSTRHLPVKPICVWRMKMSATVHAGNIDILLIENIDFCIETLNMQMVLCHIESLWSYLKL